MNTKENYRFVKGVIEKINPDCKLVVVTKNRTIQQINELIFLGQQRFGENRMQELEIKAEKLKNEKIIWHFVGHLQSNKAKRAVELCEMIHSVDSIKLARKIDAAAIELGKKQKILVEVNVSGEKTKYGVKPEQLGNFLEELKKLNLKNIGVFGLMTMAPYIPAKETMPYFRKLRELAKEYGLRELSMGMSNDYRIALEEGATILRIGTAIFDGVRH